MNQFVDSFVLLVQIVEIKNLIQNLELIVVGLYFFFNSTLKGMKKYEKLIKDSSVHPFLTKLVEYK